MPPRSLLLLVFLLPLLAVTSLDDGLARTPPMGWRSWNAFLGTVNDTIVRSVADCMVRRKRTVDGLPTSLADLGYHRVGIDDGWQACNRGQRESYHAHDGTPLVNESRFPDLKGLVAYGHAAGLFMDFYHINCICMDTYTLHTNATWAHLSWIGNVQQLRRAGFDGVKIDNCGDDDGAGFAEMVRQIQNAGGKPLLIENCNQGHGLGPPRGLPTSDGWCNFHMFRTGGDIGPSFDNVMAKLQRTTPFQDLDHPISRPGCWAFPDMLEVANFGGGMAVTESRSHFGAWCIVSSPLMLSFDVTNEDAVDSVWDIISNREAIAINQEWAGHPGRLVLTNGTSQVWTKRLSTGQAILFLNRGITPENVTVSFQNLGLPPGNYYRVRDIWEKRDLPIAVTEQIGISQLGPHDSWFVKLIALSSVEASIV
jgi:alpha-galactosidase